jgi:hypothetical protein
MVSKTAQEKKDERIIAAIFEGDAKAISTMNVSTDNLRELNSFDDVATLFDGAVTAVPDILGDGFTLIENKKQLVGIEFIVVNHRFVKGDHGDGGYSIVHVMTRDGRKVLFLDGGSGIHAQFTELHTRGMLGQSALHVPGGLRESNYETMIDGKMQAATTFYLSTTGK